MRKLFIISMFFLMVGLFPGVKIPAPAKAKYKLIDALKIQDVAKVKKIWAASFKSEDKTPVSVIKIGKSKVLKLTLNYKGTTFKRASWDCKTKLDLLKSSGLQLMVYCQDPTPVGTITMYLGSGKGWYVFHFGLKKLKKWYTVKLDKKKIKTEGTPDGWDKINKIRLSFWRRKGAEKNTDVYLSSIGVIK